MARRLNLKGGVIMRSNVWSVFIVAAALVIAIIIAIPVSPEQKLPQQQILVVAIGAENIPSDLQSLVSASLVILNRQEAKNVEEVVGIGPPIPHQENLMSLTDRRQVAMFLCNADVVQKSYSLSPNR